MHAVENSRRRGQAVRGAKPPGGLRGAAENQVFPVLEQIAHRPGRLGCQAAQAPAQCLLFRVLEKQRFVSDSHYTRRITPTAELPGCPPAATRCVTPG